jgi:bifunctional non-homologous end joining protein LigD
MSCTSVTPLGFIKPELPKWVPEPPSGEGWIHEIKHDGYRTLIVIDQGKVRGFFRHGRDWTGPYRRVVEAADKLSCQAAIMDGEIIVQDENGVSAMPCARLSTRRRIESCYLLSICSTSTARICAKPPH